MSEFLAFNEVFTAAGFAALLQVLFIDLVLAGDNAIVVGLAAAGTDPSIRQRVIFWGIGGAVVLRIIFALITVQLLALGGWLIVAGGLLLLWVCWKMFREIRTGGNAETQLIDQQAGTKTFGQALFQIILADVSMSLDNVLAVAGAAKDHPSILILGLLISVILMGAAATLIARLLQRYHWIAWIGLLVILYVAIDMIWRGSQAIA